MPVEGALSPSNCRVGPDLHIDHREGEESRANIEPLAPFRYLSLMQKGRTD